MAKANTQERNITLKKGEKQYLYERLKLKYEKDSRIDLNLSSNRMSYQPLADALTEFVGDNKKKLEEDCSIKFEQNFEVGTGQLEGLFGYTKHRDKFLDTCYLYLHNKTRSQFLRDNPDSIFFAEEIAAYQNKVQNEALTNEEDSGLKEEVRTLMGRLDDLEIEKSNADKDREALKGKIDELEVEKSNEATKIDREKKALNAQLNESILREKKLNLLKWLIPILVAAIGFLSYKWYQWETIKKNMHILQYQPNQAEIDGLVGIWTADIGSPLSRPKGKDSTTLKDNYAHNVMEITYSEAGYFKIRRYGASFYYIGYAQYESDSLISIMTIQRNGEKHEVMPKIRHTLMRLDRGNDSFRIVISASWEGSAADKSVVDIDDNIGIREIYKRVCSNGRILVEPERKKNKGLFYLVETSCEGSDSLFVDFLPLKNYPDSLLVGYESFIRRDPRRK